MAGVAALEARKSYSKDASSNDVSKWICYHSKKATMISYLVGRKVAKWISEEARSQA